MDECWQLIGASSNRQAAESVLELAKTIRGYGGSLVCATQDLNDFFALDDGKYGKGIINNSKTKILLNLEEEEAQRVQGVLHLSEAELMEITHFERGSALISTNNNGYQMVNRADVGGKYQGTWQTATASWVTIIRRLWNTPTLPKTGY